jgi:DNA polymerase
MYRYCDSPAFAILLVAYAIETAPVQLIDVTDLTANKSLAVFNALVKNPNVILHAHNAQFEWRCLRPYFDDEIPISRFRCSMALARYCGYPGRLSDACRTIDLPVDKQKDADGAALIKLFCTPKGKGYQNYAAYPDEWARFKEYCRQDVEAERALTAALPLKELPPPEQALWELDAAINARGVHVDRELIAGARKVNETVQMRAEITSHFMFPELEKPRNPVEFVEKLRGRGIDIPDAREATLNALDMTQLTPQLAKAVIARHELTRSSLAKYEAMERAICEDGRIRGALMYYGAGRTGRWSGRLVQPQNMPKITIKPEYLADIRDGVTVGCFNTVADRCIAPDISPADALSQCVRTAIKPAQGKRLIVADYSSIEARVLAWLAREDWLLELFRTGAPIYETMASRMFGVPVERIVKGNPEYSYRQKGKTAVLACGYGGGVKAFERMGGKALGMTEEEMAECVKAWRQAHHRVCKVWYAMEAAAADVVKEGRIGAGIATGHIGNLLFRLVRATGKPGEMKTALTIQLPNKRKLRYLYPRCDRVGDYDHLTYMGQAGDNGKWQRLTTFGGKLTENIVQAISRDILADALTRAEQACLNPILHVHDEIVCEVDEKLASEKLAQLLALMHVAPDWAEGLPLSAEGDVYEYYSK